MKRDDPTSISIGKLPRLESLQKRGYVLTACREGTLASESEWVMSEQARGRCATWKCSYGTQHREEVGDAPPRRKGSISRRHT